MDDGFSPENAEYPENDKLANVHQELTTIMEFLEWLGDTHKIELCDIPQGYDHTYMPVPIQYRTLVYEFFKLNERVLEEERRAMLRAYQT